MADEYTTDIKENPDYQLVMTFLKNINPGDMDEESAKQLMMIGQRIQGGGVLSEREREMFEAVVGATDRFPVEQMDTFPQGTNPDIMKDPNMGAVSEGEMKLAMDTAMPENLTPEQMANFMDRKTAAAAKATAARDKMQRSFQVDDGMEQMTNEQLQAALDSGQIMSDDPRPGMMPDTPSPQMAPRPQMAPSPQGNVMSLQEAIEAGFVTPTRPQPRPTAPMTSMRPQTRRTR